MICVGDEGTSTGGWAWCSVTGRSVSVVLFSGNSWIRWSMGSLGLHYFGLVVTGEGWELQEEWIRWPRDIFRSMTCSGLISDGAQASGGGSSKNEDLLSTYMWWSTIIEGSANEIWWSDVWVRLGRRDSTGSPEFLLSCGVWSWWSWWRSWLVHWRN